MVDRRLASDTQRAMAYKIRKLKTVGLRQNAPQPSSMSLRIPMLAEMVALVGLGILAFGVARSILPRPGVAAIAIAFALVIGGASMLRRIFHA